MTASIDTGIATEGLTAGQNHAWMPRAALGGE